MILGRLARPLMVAASMAALGGLAVAPASAAPQAPNVVPGSYCVTWIDGQWGHAHCVNNTGRTITAKIDVICNAWWDSDVHHSAAFNTGSAVDLQGECYSSVDSVAADTF